LDGRPEIGFRSEEALLYNQVGKVVGMNLIAFLILGALAGWLAGVLTRGGGFGLLGDMGVGIVGAFIGGFLFSLAGLDTIGFLGALVSATVGAVVLLGIVGMINRA
jgi:uncharacterized membrane protein YeaQ/YmgE (transglycosylase-associated protein family)